MSLSAIPKGLRRQVFDRDHGRCQYCQLTQIGQAATFHVNHVLPKSKGGKTDQQNLVLQCPYCSLHKADKTFVNDPITNVGVAIFHPLEQKWDEHFVITSEGTIQGRTPAGRATIEALHMNDLLPQVARVMQIRSGLISISKS